MGQHMTWPPSPAHIAAQFNARAESYDRSPMHRWLARRAVDRCRLRPGLRVLDAAAGTGLVLREIIERLARDGLFYAVDLAHELLEAARQADNGIDVIRADVHQLPFASSSVDLVTCVSAVAYFADPEAAFREMRRVLVDGGQLTFQVFGAGTMTAPALLRQVLQEAGIIVPDPNARVGTVEACVSLVKASGFAHAHIDIETWDEPLPEAERFWSYHQAHVFPEAFAKLSEAAAMRAAAAFRGRLEEARQRDPLDHQKVLFVAAG
jgi:ubiquinone/menaquinone biosynthesis C-methylase UbiE